MAEFFRHCPGCGRRFHIKLEEKKIVHDEKRVIPSKQPTLEPRGGVSSIPYLARSSMQVTMVEGKQVILEEKDFQYKYKCGHCGHEWTEHRVEEHRD